MNIKPKSSSRRKESHSRDHHSSVRSHSRSNDKNKPTGNSKPILRLRPSEHSQEQLASGDDPHTVGGRLALKKTKSSKDIDGSNQYYNRFHGKSKSKGKIQVAIDEPGRMKYMNSVYMHKESGNPAHSQLEYSNLEGGRLRFEREREREEGTARTGIMSKFKMLERHCGMDANGKIVAKQTMRYQYAENSKNMDSQNTISIQDAEKKRDKKKTQGRDKNRKDTLKGAKSKRGEERHSEIYKIAQVKSAEKCMRKRDCKGVNSPSFLQKYSDGEFMHSAQVRHPKFDRSKYGVVTGISSGKGIKTQQNLEQTQTSPNQQKESPPGRLPHNISYQTTIKQISEDELSKLNCSKLKYIYGSELSQQRSRCIEMLSKLSASFCMRRQAHSLAICYMDKYMLILDKDVSAKQLKLIAMTSLLLALKMDDGIMSRKLAHEYIHRMEGVLGLVIKGGEPHKGKDLSSASNSRGKEFSSTYSSKENSVSKTKSHNTSELGLMMDPKKSRKQQPGRSKEMNIILSLQLDMMIKFNFKLMQRSSTYWIDLLTTLWDGYIIQEMPLDSDLLFRSERSKRNISHLFQIVEKVASHLEMYQFSKAYIVLSAMYLIVRMQLEEQKERQGERKIYARFIENLSRSTNLIFYDKVGVNELFGFYLEELDMNISNLVECIRFVGRNMNEKMKVFVFNVKSKYINAKNYEHQLSIYEGADE